MRFVQYVIVCFVCGLLCADVYALVLLNVFVCFLCKCECVCFVCDLLSGAVWCVFDGLCLCVVCKGVCCLWLMVVLCPLLFVLFCVCVC